MGTERRRACFVWADGHTTLFEDIPDAVEGWICRRDTEWNLRAFQTFGSGNGPVLAIDKTGAEDEKADGVVVFVERPMKLLRLSLEAAKENRDRWQNVVDGLERELAR